MPLTPEQKTNLRTALLANYRALIAGGVGSNQWKCTRAIAQALADSITPAQSAGDVDQFAEFLLEAMGDEGESAILRGVNNADPEFTAIGANGPVVLPGGGGGTLTFVAAFSWTGDGAADRVISATPVASALVIVSKFDSATSDFDDTYLRQGAGSIPNIQNSTALSADAMDISAGITVNVGGLDASLNAIGKDFYAGQWQFT